MKYFTPKEATRMLPLVKSIVKDIVETGSELRTLFVKQVDINDKNQNVISLRDDLVKYTRELEELGCYFKDWSFERGQVDFPSKLNGEDVYLSWRTNDNKLMYYHNEGDCPLNLKLIPR
jgi:hypothetical protein